MRIHRKDIILAVIICIICTVTNAAASPPACFRNNVSMFINSNAVVEAEVIKSRRWKEGRMHDAPGC